MTGPGVAEATPTCTIGSPRERSDQGRQQQFVQVGAVNSATSSGGCNPRTGDLHSWYPPGRKLSLCPLHLL